MRGNSPLAGLNERKMGTGRSVLGPLASLIFFLLIFIFFLLYLIFIFGSKKYQELGTITDENPVRMNGALELRIQQIISRKIIHLTYETTTMRRD